MSCSSAHFATYCAAGVFARPISSIRALVMRVFTEMSTVVTVTFGQAARSAMRVASGSHQ